MALAELANGDLASASLDYTIKIWNPNDGTLKRTITGNTIRPFAISALLTILTI